MKYLTSRMIEELKKQKVYFFFVFGNFLPIKTLCVFFFQN